MLANTLFSLESKGPTSTWNESTCSWPLLTPSGEVSTWKADQLRQRLSRRHFSGAPSAWQSRGFKDPRRETPGQKDLDAEFSTKYRKWRSQDPAPKPQQALPNTTVRWIARSYARCRKRLQIVGHLIVMAYFFLLRVGEYTPSSEPRQTVPLRLKDVKLWKNGRRLPNNAALNVLLQADAVSICLENQKNGFKNCTLHHYASGDVGFCPVRSIAYLVHEIASLGADTPLGTFVDEDGTCRRVSASDIRAAVIQGAVGDNLEAAGYDLTRIGSHSLRSGGATNLKIRGYSDALIKKLGRWSSDTFLKYIQSQIGELTEGVAASMAESLRFLNVCG